MFGGNFRFDLTMFCWPRKGKYRTTPVKSNHKPAKPVKSAVVKEASTISRPEPSNRRYSTSSDSSVDLPTQPSNNTSNALKPNILSSPPENSSKPTHNSVGISDANTDKLSTDVKTVDVKTSTANDTSTKSGGDNNRILEPFEKTSTVPIAPIHQSNFNHQEDSLENTVTSKTISLNSGNSSTNSVYDKNIISAVTENTSTAPTAPIHQPNSNHQAEPPGNIAISTTSEIVVSQVNTVIENSAYQISSISSTDTTLNRSHILSESANQISSSQEINSHIQESNQSTSQHIESSSTEQFSSIETEMKKRIIPTDINNSDIKDPPMLKPISRISISGKSENENIDTKSVGLYEPRRQVEFTANVTIIENDEDTEDTEGPEDTEDIEMERREGIRAPPVNVDSTTEIPKYPKSDEDILHLKNAFAGNDFLENVLKGQALDSVINAMQEHDVNADDIIIQEGEPGNNMYVSSRGTYEIYVKNKLFATFSDKRVFGELAILYNSKRLATIKAVSKGKLWILQRDIYQQIIVQSAIKDFEEMISFLRNVPLVNKLSDDTKSKVANLLKKEFFKTETVIVREGDVGDKFYIIRAGAVTISKEKEGKVSELGRGAFFGERALLKDDERRQATVVANPPGVECLTLTREEFNKHFKDIIIKDGNTFEEAVISTPRRESFHPTNEYSHVTLDDLNRIITLGLGGFGRVELVQHKTDSDVTFALKYLKKIDMVQQEQVEHVFNERDIQISCNSMFIVRMYNTFQDNKYLYFLMESCMGGDLWTYLQKRKGRMVPEFDARFFAACVLEAFAFLHERNYIYRDLKPENLLLDSKGYIKLTDFGFAKNLKQANKTYTFAGTPEYVAPEIIYNRGHDKSVDYWAFGILIFELLVGKTPFRSDDHTNMMTYNRILRGINNVPFPPHVKNSANHLIHKLCRPIPTDRLGNQKNGIDDIRTHKWFQGFDWEKLRNRKMKAPFVPTLKSNIDPRYFEKFNDDDDIPPDESAEYFSGF